MTMIVFDYADIRSRMLGEDKPKTKKADALFADNFSVPPWAGSLTGVDPAQPGSDRTGARVALKDRLSRDPVVFLETALPGLKIAEWQKEMLRTMEDPRWNAIPNGRKLVDYTPHIDPVERARLQAQLRELHFGRDE